MTSLKKQKFEEELEKSKKAKMEQALLKTNEKYSNVILFNRREKEFESSLKVNTYTASARRLKKFSKFGNQTLQNNTQSSLRNNNATFNFTNGSFTNMTNNKLTKTNFKDSLYYNNICNTTATSNNIGKSINNRENKSSSKFNISNTFLITASNIKTEYNSINPSKPSVSRKELFVETGAEFLKKLDENANKPHYLLSDDDNKLNDSKSLVEIKTKQFNVKKQSVKDFIGKTRDLILMKYTSDIKHERAVRLKETYENEIESVNDTIKSLKQAKLLFNDTFYVKFNDYVKHLVNQKDVEKAILIKLQQDKNKLISENVLLSTKIQKNRQVKGNIIRWLYFQIRVKEKLLHFPYEYAQFLQENDLDKADLNLAQNIKKSGNSNNLSNNFNGESRQRKFTKEEKDRIRGYKNHLIYQTPDELEFRFKNLEDENIRLISICETQKNILYEMNNEKARIQEDCINEENKLKELLNEKMKIANDLEKKYQLLVNERNMLLNNTQMKHHPIKLVTSINIKQNNLNSTNIPNKKNVKYKMYWKIVKIYKVVAEVEKNSENCAKKLLSTEGEMLFMLKHTEFCLDKLLNIVDSYNKNKEKYGAILKEVKNNIEKTHKSEKAQKQREEELNKIKRLKEEIDKKNNKCVLIAKRKVNIYYNNMNKKESVTKNPLDDFYNPNFEDFMYDLD